MIMLATNDRSCHPGLYSRSHQEDACRQFDLSQVYLSDLVSLADFEGTENIIVLYLPLPDYMQFLNKF